MAPKCTAAAGEGREGRGTEKERIGVTKMWKMNIKLKEETGAGTEGKAGSGKETSKCDTHSLGWKMQKGIRAGDTVKKNGRNERWGQHVKYIRDRRRNKRAGSAVIEDFGDKKSNPRNRANQKRQTSAINNTLIGVQIRWWGSRSLRPLEINLKHAGKRRVGEAMPPIEEGESELLKGDRTQLLGWDRGQREARKHENSEWFPKN